MLEFDFLWNGIPPLELPEEESATCVYAARFAEWCAALCAPLRESPGLVAINQATLLLLHAYFNWRTVVPRSHRYLVREQGHRCIWHVFEETYGALKSAELVLAPPPLSLPPRPRKPRRVEHEPFLYLGDEAEVPDA